MKKIVLISIFLIVLSFLSTGCSHQKNVVETKEEALTIAQNYVEKKFDRTFSEYDISANCEDALWIVNYSLKSEKEGTEILGGGGPTVKIDKSNGKVVHCLLQK